MRSTPNEFPVFGKVDRSVINSMFKRIDQYLALVAPALKLTAIETDGKAMLKIIDLIEKKRVYFHIFHNCSMGELNEGALLCFWIVKLNPFSSKSLSIKELNIKIALSIIGRVFNYVAKEKKMRSNLNEKMLQALYYGFHFRDLSKEALMLLMESLIT
jgi:hypothetical protein